MKKIYRVQFYADKNGIYNNRLFSFQVTGLVDAFRILLNFLKHGNKFRSIFYVTINDINDRDNYLFTRLIDYEKFFSVYNCPHNPTYQEAFNDFCLAEIY